jgi:hypothetical protein
MSLTQMLTVTPEKLQLISSVHAGPPLRPYLLNLKEEQLIDFAVSRLQIAVQVVEWGAPLFQRMHVPVVIRVSEIV